MIGTLVVVAAMAASAGPAAAQGVPDDNSGVDQYVPSAPGAGGPNALRPGRGGAALDPAIAAQLTSQDKLLGQLATDTGLGAPGGGATGANASDSLFDGELLALLAVLAAIGAGGVFLMRRRSDGSGPTG